MACKIVINAKRRKQSWESKYEMLSVMGSMKRSSRGLAKSLLQKEVLSKEWTEAMEWSVRDKSVLGRGSSRCEGWEVEVGLTIWPMRERPRWLQWSEKQRSIGAEVREVEGANLWVVVWTLVVTFIWEGFPGGTRGKETACQCRRHKRCRFNP